MAERISRRLVLLSSAAIGAVYLAGYLGTEAADASLAGSPATASPSPMPAATVTPAATATAATPAQPQTARARPPAAAAPTRPPATATPQPTATATVAATGLRDGTYSGVGDSRRGSVQVALTVKSGRITNVAITGATTQYPVAWIAELPGEVVASQSAQVDLISGATYSSLAFQGAVQQALAQARG